MNLVFFILIFLNSNNININPKKFGFIFDIKDFF